MEHESPQTVVMPMDLTFRVLESITNSFSKEHKVGSGGFGEVYKGVLHDGTEIAIKKLYQMVGLDDVQFKREFENLMRVQHKNIIQLVGYCYETRRKCVKVDGEFVFAQINERALCFEYVQRGNLEKHLSDESCGLDWNTRYRIIKGTCDGLDYLHNGSEGSIFHLDLKPANILLDENMLPKIADFGLSRLFDSTQTQTTKHIVGTPAYMPPEYINNRQISKKFDIFSLGVIVIQIMAGPSGYTECAEMSSSKKFIEHVQEKWKRRLHATSRYITSLEADILEVKTCIEIAVSCVQADREKRPTIQEIIDKLNEIETLRKSLKGQGSECKLQSLLIDPLELRFPFELDSDVSCVLQLTNSSSDFVTFSAKANQSKYRSVPEMGIIQPWSNRYVIATLLAQRTAPPDNMRCDDLFLIRSARLVSNEGSTLVDHDVEDFEKMMVGKSNEAVDEARLPIVYVALPMPPSA